MILAKKRTRKVVRQPLVKEGWNERQTLLSRLEGKESINSMMSKL